LKVVDEERYWERKGPSPKCIYKDDYITIDWIHGDCINEEMMSVYQHNICEAEFVKYKVLKTSNYLFPKTLTMYPNKKNDIIDSIKIFLNLVDKKYKK